ncbi:hypothetical protein HPB48_015757 [Haemaphysalis longicornis]|uniref:Uncharacterized protein n=1 Tax=Haemaphysalis longicornis TaxID=44386 RepID=A0A9J6FV60_HAELO|nr:hypothetical protein HPB48_015757 [Haemaphysalis longicornis]
MASLVCKQNPTILQARCVGTYKSAIIVFDANKVPHFVYYRGAEYRWFLQKSVMKYAQAVASLGIGKMCAPLRWIPCVRALLVKVAVP